MANNKIKKSIKVASAWQELLVRGSSQQTNNPTPFWFFKGILFLVLLIFAFRLISLQLVEGSFHLKRAEENRIITRRQAAARGAITDRNDISLVRNKPAYKRLVPGSTLAEGNFETISKDQALSLEGSEDEWVFFDIEREYIYGAPFVHLVGYVGEVSKEELDLLDPSYQAGDLVGKQGVELLFESNLRGSPGSELMEVNSSGELLRTLGTKDPEVGNDIKLSLDSILQQRLFNQMEGRAGAVIATDPNTGEVLALISSPSFDPNNPAGALQDENQPYFNRAIGGAYPPGSTFKIITSTAGLEEKVIDITEEIEDTGEIRIDQYRYGNWYFDQYGKKDEHVNLVKAIQRSNDIFFYRLGEKLGANAISDWAKLFGLGSKTDIGLLGEVDGLVPSPEWKRKYLGSRWFLGNTYHFAIGQGDLQTTPIQINQMTGVIANGGRLCSPNLLFSENDSTVGCQELGISPSTIEAVKEGMIAACTEGGTAFPFFEFEPQVACKTGTAQFGDPEDKTHAWFTVFAPAENPEIVLTVLLEKGGEGSYDAAPIAKEALDYWFSIKN